MEEWLWRILPYIITILIGIFGAYFLYFKGKLKEVKEFVNVLWEAIQDDKITKDELEKIIKEFMDIWKM